MGLRFCLVKDKTLGVVELFNASSQHSIVSVLSAGLKTFKLGIVLKPDNCSIGCQRPTRLEICEVSDEVARVFGHMPVRISSEFKQKVAQ